MEACCCGWSGERVRNDLRVNWFYLLLILVLLLVALLVLMLLLLVILLSLALLLPLLLLIQSLATVPIDLLISSLQMIVFFDMTIVLGKRVRQFHSLELLSWLLRCRSFLLLSSDSIPVYVVRLRESDDGAFRAISGSDSRRKEQFIGQDLKQNGKGKIMTHFSVCLRQYELV